MKKWLVVCLSVTMMAAVGCGDDDDNNGTTNNGANNGGTNNGGSNNGGSNNGGTDMGNNGGTDMGNNGGTDMGNNGGTDMGGNDGGTDMGGNGDNSYDVTGAAVVHPVDQVIDDTLTLTGASIQLEAAGPKLIGNQTILTDGDGNDAIMDLTPNTGAETTADFMFSQVDVSDINLGLLGVIDDSDGSTDDTWVPTVTGLAGSDIDANVENNSFVLSNAAEGALAQLNGGSAGDLLTDGFILGQFVDGNGDPVDGVKLVDNPNGDEIADVFYPNADFSGLETDGDTSANGVFVVTGGGLKSYTGEKTDWSFSDQQAGILGGFAFVMFLPGSAN